MKQAEDDYFSLESNVYLAIDQTTVFFSHFYTKMEKYESGV